MFDVCRIDPRYQIYLCVQAAELFYADDNLYIPEYTYEPCKEVLPDIPMYQCPNMSARGAKYVFLEQEYTFYLSGSAKKATSIIYYKVKDKDMGIEAAGLIQGIDLGILKDLEKTKMRSSLDNVCGLTPAT